MFIDSRRDRKNVRIEDDVARVEPGLFKKEMIGALTD
jgi:hypothetical protein